MPNSKTAEHETHSRSGAAHALDQARDATSHARDAAADAARRTAQSLEANPLGILVGGLAVGALAGTLIPRSAKERELLAPLGRQLGERARAAVQAAREAGQGELDSLGLSKSAARDQARSLFDGLAKAVTTAGAAAAKSATAKPGQSQE